MVRLSKAGLGGAFKVMRSPLTGKSTIYVLTSQTLTSEYFEYPLDALRDAYNSELATQGVDGFVEEVKKVRGTFYDIMLMDTWVAAEGPIPVAWAALIIFILKATAITVAAAVILSAAASFAERLWPKPKFYTPDGQVFEDFASYFTYMQNIYNPAEGKPYTSPYTGEGFATQEELDKHMTDFPYKAGEWYQPLDFVKSITGLLVIGGVIFVAVTILPRVIDFIIPKR